MKKLLSLLLVFMLSPSFLPAAALAAPIEANAKSLILMEKESGIPLFEENSHEALEPASVTKVMTLLLIMEALESGRIQTEDMVVTSANAAGMGGSQVFLKEGEQMSVDDMLKAIAIASANDASVAMAEHLAGSESAFVEQMNQRAVELGMMDTMFQNCSGLPAEGHVTSAYDIALMSRELLLRHPGITHYTSIWMDTLRNGDFQLANTNKLIYYYNGATGLKTGSTDAALYCLSASAARDGMELIAVVLGSPSSIDRFESAKALLNYGFANYALANVEPEQPLPPVLLHLGQVDSIQPIMGESSHILLEKSSMNHISTEITLDASLEAPIEAGQVVGEMLVLIDGELYETIPLIAPEAVSRLTLPQLFQKLSGILLSGR